MGVEDLKAGKVGERRFDFDVKGSVLRGRIQALRALGLFDECVAKLTPAERRSLEDTVMISSWVDGALVIAIDEAIYNTAGETRLREVALKTLRDSVSPILRSAVEGVLHLFGTSPKTLFSRLDLLSRSTIRGMQFVWTPRDDRSGVMTVSYPTSYSVPRSAFIAISAGLVNVFELAAVRGTVELTRVDDAPPRNRATFDCRW